MRAFVDDNVVMLGGVRALRHNVSCFWRVGIIVVLLLVSLNSNYNCLEANFKLWVAACLLGGKGTMLLP